MGEGAIVIVQVLRWNFKHGRGYRKIVSTKVLVHKYIYIYIHLQKLIPYPDFHVVVGPKVYNYFYPHCSYMCKSWYFKRKYFN